MTSRGYTRQAWEQQKLRLFLPDEDEDARLEVYRAASQRSPSGQSTAQTEHPLFDSLVNPDDIRHYLSGQQTCHTFFIRQLYSWDRLAVSQLLFSELEHSLWHSAEIQDMMLFFGERAREAEIVPPSVFAASSQNRGKRNALICGLRYIERNYREHEPGEVTEGWSVRQSATYCQWSEDDEKVRPLCVFLTLSSASQQTLNDYFAACQVSDRRFQPVEMVARLYGVSLENWRHYLIDLVFEVERNVAQLCGASPTGHTPIRLEECGRGQAMLRLEIKVTNAIVVVKATIADIEKLIKASYNFETTTDHEVISALRDQILELDRVALQLEGLHTQLRGMSQLVSSLLSLANGFALQDLSHKTAKENEEMAKLTKTMYKLSEASAKENEEMSKLTRSMHKLNQKTAEDSVTVRILTTLTLIYLPTTVVSNFFSTSFVGTTAGKDGRTRITVSCDWWILLVASVGLTAVTLFLWRLWVMLQRRNDPWLDFAGKSRSGQRASWQQHVFSKA